MKRVKKETNYEHYADQIKDIIDASYGFNATSNSIMPCAKMSCSDCIMSSRKIDGWFCRSWTMREWLDEEYEDPMESVDWSKLAVDTPVIVWDTKACQVFAYFAKYENGKIYIWRDGKTSLTVRNILDSYDKTISYNHGRLVTKEDLK